MLYGETQMLACMCQALTPGNLPETEHRACSGIVRTGGAYLQQRVSRCGPPRGCLAGIEPRIFGNSATPSGTLKRGFAY